MKGREMPQTALYRISAVLLLVGAVIVTVGNLLGPQGGAREAVASGMYYPAAVVALLGGLLVMAGLPAIYLRQRAESGVPRRKPKNRRRISSRVNPEDCARRSTASRYTSVSP